MVAPRRGEGGFRTRCSGQRGGLTGARVTGPHIGELSVSICLPERNPAGCKGDERGRDEASEIGRERVRVDKSRTHTHTHIGGTGNSREREYTLTKMLII